MKVDRYGKDLYKKLDGFSNSNIDDINNRLVTKHDEYCLDTGSIPDRFLYYRHVRANEWEALGHKPWDHVYDLRITQDELDYFLKAKLRVPPEDRYQHEKVAWYFHESSWCMRGLDATGYDGYGCNNGECIPECRFYPETGSIEDEEVIQRHRDREQRYRDKTFIEFIKSSR